MSVDVENDIERKPQLYDRIKRGKTIPTVIAALAVTSSLGLIIKSKIDSNENVKKVKDATLEGYLQASGFNQAGLPLDVSGGASHLVVSCTPSTTDLETITNPKIEFNIDESGNAYLIDEPLKDAAGTALGESVVIPFPLITPEDVSAFISDDLSKFCIAAPN